MYRHHHGPVFRVDVEQGGGSHQVLRQVAQQWHCPVNTYLFLFTHCQTVIACYRTGAADRSAYSSMQL